MTNAANGRHNPVNPHTLRCRVVSTADNCVCNGGVQRGSANRLIVSPFVTRALTATLPVKDFTGKGF